MESTLEKCKQTEYRRYWQYNIATPMGWKLKSFINLQSVTFITGENETLTLTAAQADDLIKIIRRCTQYGRELRRLKGKNFRMNTDNLIKEDL